MFLFNWRTLDLLCFGFGFDVDILEDDCCDACCGLEGFSISEDLDCGEIEGPENAPIDAVDCKWTPSVEEAPTEELVLVVLEDDCLDVSLGLAVFSKSGDIDFGGIEGPEYAPI